MVRDLRSAQPGQTLRGESDEQAASVSRVGPALDEPDRGEPVNRSRDSARAEVAPLPEISDRQQAVLRADERHEYAVGVNAEAMLGERSRVERAEDGCVHPQHAAPRPELGGREGSGLRELVWGRLQRRLGKTT